MTEIKVIGLCGRSGSGKGYVCERFHSRGIPSIDTDKVYRDILGRRDSECLSELTLEFGEGILKDGSLDRRALAQIVFAKGNEKKLERLNEISHKHILKETRSMIDEYSKKGVGAVIVDAPTFIESGFHRECDTVISIISPASLRIERIIARDGLTRERAEARILAQKPNEFYEKHSHYVLTNEGDAEEFLKKAKELCSRLSLPLS